MSTLPTRRTLRTTRTTTARDAENAHARPSRIVSRAKPLSSVVTNHPAAAAKGKTVADATGVHGKRKRDVLIEVPPNINGKDGKTAKGKGKDKFEGVVIPAKPKTHSSATRPTGPQRKVGVRHEAAAVAVDDLPSLAEEEDELPTDDRMLVDPRSEYVAIPERLSGARHPEEHRSKRVRTSSEAPQASEDGTEVPADDADEELFDLHLHSIEADPLGDDWDDLDADDNDDPMMVNEYVVEIFDYLKEIETITMPNPMYMQTHKELSWRMRGVLLDWLVGVHARCRLTPETFHLCTNILDRFMSLRVCSLVKFQLVGITCMFIAAKVEETMAPCASDLILLTDGAYTDAQMFQAERYILKSLDYNLNHPNAMHFLRRISKADDYNIRVRTLGKYFIEIGCMEWRLMATPPSLMAAGAMWLSRLILGMENWTPNLAHYSTYSQSEILPTANYMLNYVLKPTRHEQFHKKYARKANMKASEIVKEWALDRWVEGSDVCLEDELPAIKLDIRSARAQEEAAAVEFARRR